MAFEFGPTAAELQDAEARRKRAQQASRNARRWERDWRERLEQAERLTR